MSWWAKKTEKKKLIKVVAKTSGRSNEKEICANRSYSSSCLLWILRDVEKRVGRGGGKSWTSSWISIPPPSPEKQSFLLCILSPSDGSNQMGTRHWSEKEKETILRLLLWPRVIVPPKESHIPGLGRWLPIKLCRHHQFSSQGRRRRKTKHRIGGGSPNWSQRKRRLRIADVICSSKHPQSILYTRIVSNRSTNLFKKKNSIRRRSV